MRRNHWRLVVPLMAGLLVWAGATSGGDSGPKRQTPAVNPAIDMPGFLRAAEEAAKHRESRRVSEADFLRMSREPNTIILDARSARKYDLLHIRGAINLSFPDITIASLAETVPDHATRILIYCNNNFRNAEKPFPSKLPATSLNLSTYSTLYAYGYRNIYELAPQIDPAQSILPLEPTADVKPDADANPGRPPK